MRSALAGPAAPGGSPERLWDVDWLRVLAIAGIFVYHAARPFDSLESWHVKFHTLTEVLTYPMAFGAQFMMPLFWVLSGMGTAFALGAHPAGAFMRRRAARLLIPVVTIGWFVSGPVQVYIEATTVGNYNVPAFEGSFREFLPHYFSDGMYGFGGYFALTGLHLWYLTYLFAFTAASLPLFLWLRRPRGRRAMQRLAGWLTRPAALVLLALPVLAVEVVLPRNVPILAWEEGGWLLGSHWVFLVLGFLLVSDERLRPAVWRQRWWMFAVAAVTTVPLALFAAGVEDMAFASPAFVAFMSLRSLNGWLWLLAILGFGTHLSRPTPLLAYVGPAVLPFYILHQPLIVVIGYLLRDWDAPILLAYAVVFVGVLAISAASYEFAIRRVGVLRLLFGMNPLPGAPGPA